jgi:hypothetical protein
VLPIVVRSEPHEVADYRLYEETLRWDFFHACAYCTITEGEAEGVTFEIDHYVPDAHPEGRALRTKYANLLWACKPCNQLKTSFFPSEALMAQCYRFYRPDWDAFADAFAIEDTRLRPLTNVGRYTERLLLLNDLSYRKLRELRAEINDVREYIAEGLTYLLRVKIDTIKPAARLKFGRLRAGLEAQLAALDSEAQLPDIVRNANRSPLLGPNPDHDAELARRRDFLEEIGASPHGHRRTPT